MGMKNLDTLGSRLRHARRKAKVSQDELANIVGVSQAVISKIERGDQDASTKINEFARALGCDAFWLSSGKHSGESDDLRFMKENYESLTDSQKSRLIDSLKDMVALNLANSRNRS